MRRRAWVVMAVVLLACGEPPAAPEEPAPEPPPVPAPPVEAEADVPAVEIPWRWYHRVPARGSSLFDGALSEHMEVHEVGRPHRLAVRREGGALVLRREDGELDAPPETSASQRYSVGATGAPVVGTFMDGDIAIAAPTDAGYVLVAVDAEMHETRWTVHHDEDGPGAVQLQLSGDRGVVAYVAGERGAYVHVLRASDGALVGRARYGSEVRPAFSPPANPTAVGRGRASDSGHRLVRAGPEHHAVVGPGWRQQLPQPDPFATHASFLEVDDTIVVVSFCNGASGATVYGLDRATGAVRFLTSGGSLGMLGHSRYSNDVRVRREGHLVRVYGDESAGRYVGTIDVSEGRLLGYEVWRP